VTVPKYYYDGLFEILSSSYVTIDGLRTINSDNVGITCHGPGASNITIKNCYTYNTDSSGISAWGLPVNRENYDGIQQLVIENNEVEFALTGNDGWQECLTVADGVDGFIIRNNHVHHGGPGMNDGGPLGIDAKVGVRNGEIYGNHVHHIWRSSGIYVDAWDYHTYNIAIYGNLIHNCDDAGISIGGEQGGDVSNIDIYNNLVYDNCGGYMGDPDESWGSGISVNGGRGDFTNIDIYNNTVYSNNEIGRANSGGIGIYDRAVTGNIINNIVSDNDIGQILMGINKANTIMVVDRNLIDGYTGNHKCEVTGTNPILADPQFVNETARDLHLQGTSPAIDECNPALVPATDYDGVSRPQGDGYDIGAYEYESGPAAPVADFSGNPLSGNPPLTVYFTDLSTGSPTSWDWTFGDGGTSQDQDPSHEYTSVNTYTVSLEACNAQGCDTETKVDYVTVSNQNCHVGAIALVGKYKGTGPPSGRGYYAEATITVHDQDCQPLSGVTVDITWSGCVSGSDSDVTDGNGQVVFESPKDSTGGTFQCCVDDLTKTGYPYASGDNHETCDSIVNP
jgi:PKD repeat protein